MFVYVYTMQSIKAKAQKFVKNVHKAVHSSSGSGLLFPHSFAFTCVQSEHKLWDGGCSQQ